MPSLVGIVARSDPDSLSALLERMLPAPPGAADEAQVEYSAQAGLGVLRRGLQSGVAVRGDFWLAFTGQIVEDEDFESRLRYLPGEPPAGFCQRLLALYEHLGPQGLQALNGRYAAAVWDEAWQRLVIINDRYGLQPLYYWRGPHEFVVSSRVAAFQQHPAFTRRLNPVGLVDLMASGQLLGEHTLYDGVRALPPAALLTFEAGRLTLQTYTRLPYYQPGRPAPAPAEAAEALGDYLREAVLRRASQDTRLLLAGGIDSRLLAGFLGSLHSGWQHTACTVALPASRDAALAAAAAQAAGLPHRVLPANPGYLRDYTPAAVQRAEGGLNAHAAWIMAAEDDLAAHPTQALMSGAGGEGISGRHMLAGLPVSTEPLALNWLFSQHWQYPQIADLLRPELLPALSESQDSLARALDEAPETPLEARLDAFYYRQERRRTPAALFDALLPVQEPYFDIDLVDFALCLPPKLRAGGRLFFDAAARCFPALAAIDVIRTQPRPPEAQRLWRRVQSSVQRTLFFLQPGPHGDDPTRAVLPNHWLRTAARSYASSLLSRGDLLGDVFDMDEVRRLLDAHLTGRSNASRRLSALVTFAEWRKVYL